MDKLPLAFSEEMKSLFGEDYSKYIESFKEEKVQGLRSNDLKVLPSELEKLVNFQLKRVPWTSNGYYFGNDQQPGKNPYYFAGLFYIQEPSAMTPVSMMPIKPGDRVADLCAAPGGKTTQIAGKLENTGFLLSNDISASRSKAVVKNIEILGIKNTVVTSEKPDKLASKFAEYFDHILVDAPCSGEGMFRKNSGMLNEWHEGINVEYQKIQKEILKSAHEMLKGNGYLMYSTCTFSKVENEDVIKWFINEYDYQVLEMNLPAHVKDLLENQITEEGALRHTVRLLPHKIKGEGHFLALLRKKSGGEGKQKIYQKKVNGKILEPFYEFQKEYLKIDFDEERIAVMNDKVYYLPENMPDLSGIRVLRNGWLLGELKRNRFEPSQSLASGLKMDQFANQINLDIEDINVMKYLKAESLNVPCQKGYNLIGVNGFALGFGKGANSKIKNKFASGWRMM